VSAIHFHHQRRHPEGAGGEEPGGDAAGLAGTEAGTDAGVVAGRVVAGVGPATVAVLREASLVVEGTLSEVALRAVASDGSTCASRRSQSA
jgi:hypothetical protein